MTCTPKVRLFWGACQYAGGFLLGDKYGSFAFGEYICHLRLMSKLLDRRGRYTKTYPSDFLLEI